MRIFLSSSIFLIVFVSYPLSARKACTSSGRKSMISSSAILQSESFHAERTKYTPVLSLVATRCILLVYHPRLLPRACCPFFSVLKTHRDELVRL